MRYAVTYLPTLLILLGLDAIWLGTVAAPMYRATLGSVLLDSFRIGPAVVFYLLYAVGIMVFAIGPAAEGGTWRTALAYGALLGLVAYGTYDLTNHATVAAWSLKLTVLDMIWGAVLTGVSAALGFVAGEYLLAWMRSP
jgi:uncharacterized membrane protein